MIFAYIFVTLILYFRIMSLNENDKWASQIIDELLEKLTIVDTNINSIVKNVSSKYPNTTKTSSFKEVDISIEDSKIFEGSPVDSPLKSKDDTDISYKTCEAEYTIHDTISDGKVNFQEGDYTKIPSVSTSETKITNMFREVSESHNASDALQNSCDKLIEAFKDIYTTYTKSEEFNVNDLDDNDSVIVVHDSRGLNALKDIHAYKTKNVIQANLSQIDENCFYKRDESCQKVDDVESNPPSKDFESEESMLQNLERIDQKVQSIGFGSKHDENAGDNTRESTSIMDAYYEWFNENYIKEEMEFRRIGVARSLLESRVSGTTTPENENLVIPYESKKYGESKHKATKVTSNVGRENELLQNHNNVIHQKGKMEDCRTTQPKGVNECMEEGVNGNSKNIYESKKYHHYELKHFEKDNDLEDVAKISTTRSSIYSCDETTCNDLMNLNNQISTKNISMQLKPKDVSLKFPPRKSLAYRVASEDSVGAQQIFRMIAMYRNVCRTFEDLALRPIAVLIAESIDVLMFVFFLSASAFYLLYRSINVQGFRDFFNKRKNISDNPSNRKKFIHQKNSDNNSLSVNRITSEDIRNYEIRRTESWHSFCSDDHDETENFSNDDVISVTPEDVCVLNSSCEHTKQTLDDFYKKGSNFCGYLSNERTTAVIKTHENALVDIILKNYELLDASLKNENDHVGVKDKAFGVNDPDFQIIRNSGESFESNRNTPENTSAFVNDKQNISSGWKKVEYPTNAIESGVNDSFSADFSINYENILNSTEIDTSDLERRSRSANNFCKVLSPSEINIFDGLWGIYQPAESFRGECLRSSHLSINEKSFASIPFKKTLSNNLSSFQTSTPNEKTSELPLEEKPDRCIENPSESCGENIREKLKINLQPVSEYSDSSSHISEIGDGEIYKCNTLFENSFVHEDPELFSNPTRANTAISNEDDSLMDQQESLTSDAAFSPKRKAPKTRKNGRLRRRATDILNYWRRMNLVQIIGRKKKYGKQIVFNDLFHF